MIRMNVKLYKLNYKLNERRLTYINSAFVTFKGRARHSLFFTKKYAGVMLYCKRKGKKTWLLHSDKNNI